MIKTQGIEPVLASRDRIEQHLRRVMVRTERPGSAHSGEDVLDAARVIDGEMRSIDIRSYCSTDRVGQLLGAENITDYWKSAPYLLNIMSEYKLKKTFRQRVDEPAMIEAIDPETLLSWDAIESYNEIDPGNARLRSLVSETTDRGMWQLLWLPPALPYYTGSGVYQELSTATKRLVFSQLGSCSGGYFNSPQLRR